MYKLKIRVILLAIAIVLSFNIITPIKVYADDSIFTDISTNDWFYEDVKNMYLQGIILGFDDGTFRPYSLISYAQVMTILCRLGGVNLDKSNSGTWYYPASEYFRDNFNIETENYNDPISRREICNYIVKFFNLEPTSEQVMRLHSFNGAFYDENNIDTVILYDLGILRGYTVNNNLIFGGDDKLVYSQAAAFFNRILLSDMGSLAQVIVESPELLAHNNSVVSFDSLYLDYSYYNNLRRDNIETEDDLLSALGYAYYTGQEYINLTEYISGASIDYANYRMNKLLEVVDLSYVKFSEFATFLRSTNIKSRVSKDHIDYTIEISYDFMDPNNTYSNNIDYIESFKSTCEEHLVKLNTQGMLSNSMSNKEKAQVIYEYLDKLLEYDLTLQNMNAYLGFKTGSTVCQGYSQMFTFMTRLLGLEAYTVRGYARSNDGSYGLHSWNRITYNGQYYYCDPTWGDPIPNRDNYSDLRWFWLTESEMTGHYLDDICYLY